jgi:hypothetical protein
LRIALEKLYFRVVSPPFQSVYKEEGFSGFEIYDLGVPARRFDDNVLRQSLSPGSCQVRIEGSRAAKIAFDQGTISEMSNHSQLLPIVWHF